jgi:uncharacterized protein (DUF2252 family)
MKTNNMTTIDTRNHGASDERRKEGKTLRDAVSRHSHAGWKAPDGRRDPVEILLESNEGRIPSLIPIRFGRMMQSPFAFYRGSASVMAADLATTPDSGLRVQACGDAHLLNFGGFATPERNIVFDINDLDETLPAPWEWDLKRLAASVAIAGRHLQLTETEAARAAVASVRSYREHMADYSSMKALAVWYDAIGLEDVLKLAQDMHHKSMAERVERAQERSSSEHVWPKLAEHTGDSQRIKDDPPLIFHPTLAQAPGLATGFVDQIAQYRNSLSDHVRVLFDRYRFCDVTFKVVGVGSVGKWCALGLWVAEENDPLFLQLKEARTSVLEPYAGKSSYSNHGQRVINGQRLMQSASDIFLGWFEAANGLHYYVRQHRDAKISAIIEDWGFDVLREYGKLCSWALAKAHARSGDAAMIAGYMGSGNTFDDAIGEFAVEYADQNQRDYRVFVEAVRRGRVPAETDG